MSKSIIASILITLSSFFALADIVIDDVSDEITTRRLPRYIDFGTVEVGDTRTSTLRITNEGPGIIRNMYIRVSGYDFRGYDNCRSALYPGDYCYVYIDFRPRSVGSFWGDLNVRTASERHSVGLRGWGERRRRY